MARRRILSLWFPRLGAERLIRREPHLASLPLATMDEVGGGQRLVSLSDKASAQGLYAGQPLRDAYALCAELVTRPAAPHREAAFLGGLHRWAGKYSPWVSAQPPDALMLDLSGCAHLFGGEAKLTDTVVQDCADLGLTVRIGLADTLGAAWALARYGGTRARAHRSGDAIDQEARATRARAGKRRHWERGGAAPAVNAQSPATPGQIAAEGQGLASLAPLPVAALRLDAQTVEQLNRLGLRRVRDLLDQPRASLARRFGRGLIDRLDQATGAAPEPVSPSAAPDRFAIRLTLPEPIGLEADVTEATRRLLDRLCRTLERKGRAARALRLEAHRCDGLMEWQKVVSAVATHDPDRLLSLLALRTPEIDAGPGIDMMRLEATVHEPLQSRPHAGPLSGGTPLARDRAMEDLISRLGARIGIEKITRLHPGDSHIPEKQSIPVPAAFTKPCHDWPDDLPPRPLRMWPPEIVQAPDTPTPPDRFRWRGRDWVAAHREGPERILPEWWLEDPNWRSGPRDYWRVATEQGDRLWLFYAHGGQVSSGWFCQGAFA